MSKEVIRASQFNKARTLLTDEELQLSDAQKQELTEIYEGSVATFKQGKIIKLNFFHCSPTSSYRITLCQHLMSLVHLISKRK